MHKRCSASFKVPLLDACYIDASDPRNRKVRAKKTLAKGDLILSVSPLALILHTNECKDRCHSCLSKCSSPKECTGCRFALYCNSECQSVHWKDHRLICPILKKAKVNPYMASKLVHLVSLLYWKANKYPEVKNQLDQMISCTFTMIRSSFGVGCGDEGPADRVCIPRYKLQPAPAHQGKHALLLPGLLPNQLQPLLRLQRGVRIFRRCPVLPLCTLLRAVELLQPLLQPECNRHIRWARAKSESD